jgi:hypothetical protein
VPKTARKHFDQDLQRVGSMLALALGQPAGSELLVGDLRRQAVAMAVGALDAYLCDAYADVLTRTLRACREGTLANLPAGYYKTLLPAGPLLAKQYLRENWGLRMAARKVIERDNMLRTSRLADMFNPGLAPSAKLWEPALLDKYVALRRRRMTKHVAKELAALKGKDREKAYRRVEGRLRSRVDAIIQRRHDIVHNCDRPKQAPQKMSHELADRMVEDIKAFVEILDEHLNKHCVA